MYRQFNKTCNHPTCNGECRRVKAKKLRKPITRRSSKVADQMKIYNQRRRKFLIANPVCVVTGNQATEIHHAKGRIGRLLLDERFWKPVSREGHQKIEENPEWAKEMGFSVSRLGKELSKK